MNAFCLEARQLICRFSAVVCKLSFFYIAYDIFDTAWDV